MNLILKLILALNIGICALIIGSCATSQVSLIQREKGLPRYNATMTNGNNQHQSIIRLISDKGHFFCTGFVIDGNYALTAAHCVSNGFGGMNDTDIHVYNSYGFATGTIAKAVAIEGYRDVAFIKGDFSNFEAQKTDFYGQHVPRGFKMISCGYPSGMFQKFCTEIEHVGNKYFQYRTKGGPIFKGMSGGPVVNSETGFAVGVNSAVDEDTVIIGPLVGVLESVGLQ